MTTFAALDKGSAKYKRFAAASQAPGIAASAYLETADTTANYYYHNTVTMATPSASHSTIASALGTGIHGIVSLLTTPGKEAELYKVIEGGAVVVQVEVALAVVRMLDQLGYTVKGTDVKVPGLVWGVQLYADLVVVGPDNKPAVCELKTVWSPDSTYNIRTDKLHTHREQALMGAHRMEKHGALCLVACIPKTETVDAIMVQSLAYTAQEVAQVCTSSGVV